MKNVEVKELSPECPDSTSEINNDKLDYDSSDQILVRQSEGVSLVIPVKINGIVTDTVVDSAAQVTVISNKLKDTLPGCIEVSGEVKLKGIGGPQCSILAQLITGVEITLGTHSYKWSVYAADMEDPVLLGLDFLVSNKCVIDFVKNEVSLPGEKIVASLKEGVGRNS